MYNYIHPKKFRTKAWLLFLLLYIVRARLWVKDPQVGV